MAECNAISQHRPHMRTFGRGLPRSGGSKRQGTISQRRPQVICPEQPAADDAEKMAMLTTLMLEPRKFSSMADLFKALPPDAMAKFGTMQAAEAERQKKDWANLCRYAAENAQVLASGMRPRVDLPRRFDHRKLEAGRSCAVQRHHARSRDRRADHPADPAAVLPDVVALRPRVVHIMAGVNDIMGNNGPTSDATIVNNIRAMIDMAKANGIRVVLAGITPAQAFVVRPADDLRPRIAAVNRQLGATGQGRTHHLRRLRPRLGQQRRRLAGCAGQ